MYACEILQFDPVLKKLRKLDFPIPKNKTATHISNLQVKH